MSKVALAFLAVVLLAGEAGAAVFSISLDAASVNFGSIVPGSASELGAGGHHNEVTAASDGGVAYYIKIYDTAPLACVSFTIPNSNFEWLASYMDGQGVLAAGAYQAFSTSPALAYSAAGNDLTGTPVHVRFRYKLTVPGAQGAGFYTTTVVYLLTETL